MSKNPFIPPVFYALLRRIKKRLRKKYPVGNFTLHLPPGHTLPDYQREYRLYDRFLPVITSFLPPDRTVVDVGANIGDTALMMLEHTLAPVVCIEPSDVFYSYLQRNLAALPTELQRRVTSIKAMVGTNTISGELKHYRGTAVLQEAPEVAGTSTTPLDDLITTPVSFIKVDTDGYDWDVLLSATRLLDRYSPVLFWENQVDNATHRNGYNALYKMLEEKNYSILYVFDNFGNLLLEKTSFTALKNLNDYTMSMAEYGCTRTLYYTDVLAATVENQSLLEKAILVYKERWIQKLTQE